MIARKETRTRRLILRPLKESDYLAWFDAYVNCLPQQSKWDLKPKDKKICTKSWFKKIKNRHKKSAQKDDYYWYGVFEKKTGRLIGHIDFNVFLRQTHQFANFGYQIYNRHWGQDYGQEAAKAGLKIGIRNLKLNRLEAALTLIIKNRFV